MWGKKHATTNHSGIYGYSMDSPKAKTPHFMKTHDLLYENFMDT
jgi:hypothetical protein